MARSSLQATRPFSPAGATLCPTPTMARPSSHTTTTYAPMLQYRQTARISPAGCGIFTSVSGTAPNRVFNIEWRTGYFGRPGTANFEVQLSESSTDINVVYGATVDDGLEETSGIQSSSSGPATQFSCGKATLTDGLQVTYSCAAGPTPTPTPTATGTPGGCTVNGSIDPSDPTQTDRLFRSGIPQTCPASTTCAIFGDATAAALRFVHVHQHHRRDPMRNGGY